MHHLTDVGLGALALGLIGAVSTALFAAFYNWPIVAGAATVVLFAKVLGLVIRTIFLED